MFNNEDEEIINDTIKIIYKNDNGKTIKNAILLKSKCNEHYKDIKLKYKLKSNSIKAINNNSKINSKINSNTNSKTLKKISNTNIKNTKKFLKKCLVNKYKILTQPKIIIKEENNTNIDIDNENNTKYSYLIIITSNVIESFHKNKIINKDQYINWVAIINDNKIDKNIIKYTLNKIKGLHNFNIRVYKFAKNDINIINNINEFCNIKNNDIILKLKEIKKMERIYTNNLIVINEKRKHTTDITMFLEVLLKLFII